MSKKAAVGMSALGLMAAIDCPPEYKIVSMTVVATVLIIMQGLLDMRKAD